MHLCVLWRMQALGKFKKSIGGLDLGENAVISASNVDLQSYSLILHVYVSRL